MEAKNILSKCPIKVTANKFNSNFQIFPFIFPYLIICIIYYENSFKYFINKLFYQKKLIKCFYT